MSFLHRFSAFWFPFLFISTAAFGTALDPWPSISTAQEDNAARKAAKAAAQGHYTPYAVRSGDSLWSLSQQFGVPVEKLQKINLIPFGRGIFPGQIVFIPLRSDRAYTAALSFVTLSPIESPLAEERVGGDLTPPISPGNIFISQGYHAAHHALDFSVDTGTSILAVAHGEVIHIEYNHPVYGHMLILDHGDNIITLYAHLSEISVRVGYIVLQGETIALSGNTGRSTRPHLHFELRQNGAFLDPCLYIHHVCE
ncbi:MAG: LysM peptidoglycan-binding domain-containing M23 family metallopeptidase [Chloroflexota bacterium]